MHTGKIIFQFVVGLLAVALFSGSQPSTLIAANTDAAPFQPGITIATDIAGAHAVQTADLDRDGDLDVIAVGRNGGLVVWYENDGAALPQFVQRPISTVQGAYSLALADLDRDGDSDLVVAAVGEVRPSQVEETALTLGVLVWFENNVRTTGSFTQQTIAGDLRYPVMTFVTDLDRDGDPDVLLAARDANAVTWYANNGARPLAFTEHLLSNNLPSPASIHTGDIDGDGDPDVIAAAEDTDKIAWYANDGVRAPGGVPAFTEHVIQQLDQPAELDLAKSVYAADLDADGDLDIAFASEGKSEIGWLENLGGAVPAFTRHLISSEADHAKLVVASDLDRDGDIDLLSASTTDGKIAWYANNGVGGTAGKPTFTTHVITTEAKGARYVHAADLDGDGDLDLLSASREDNRIVWYPNQTIHRSALFNQQTQSVISYRFEARSVYATDMDRDGDTDLLSTSGQNVTWHENNGALPPAFTDHVISDNLEGGRWVYAADLDNDGDPDVVVAAKQAGEILWYENVGGSPLSFRSYSVTRQALGARAVLAADIDSDGDLDLYSASDTDNAITWYENIPRAGAPPTFGRRVVTNNARYARSTYAADLDGDGDLDLMSASQHDNKVAWYENLGTKPPTFAERPVGTDARGAQHVHADDLDGDGDLDILAASETDNAIRWYENQRGAPLKFIPHIITGLAPAVHAIFSGDADHDGDIDLFAAIEKSNTIAWYENNGDRPATFVERIIVKNAFVAHGIYAADVDSDGDLDVLSASREDGKIAWYENQGGQYALTTQDKPSSDLAMTITLSHRGRPGDANLELNAFELQFVDSTGASLTTAQANNLMHGLQVYRLNCCENQLDPSQSPLIASVSPLVLTADGRQIVPFFDGDPNAQTPSGGTTTYAIRIETASGGCQNGVTSFRLINILSGRIAQDSSNDLPLLAETMRSLDRDSVPAERQTPVLLINEFLASNDAGILDPDDPGEYPDWIELVNTTPLTINLGGKYLTDDLLMPRKYRIPDGLSIPPKGYLLFYADGEPEQGPLHTNFKLEKNGEVLGLFEDQATGVKEIDVHVFAEQAPNVAEGRYPDSNGEWRTVSTATPGQRNQDQAQNDKLFFPFVAASPVCLD